jgi:hypothetical protein
LFQPTTLLIEKLTAASDCPCPLFGNQVSVADAHSDTLAHDTLSPCGFALNAKGDPVNISARFVRVRSGIASRSFEAKKVDHGRNEKTRNPCSRAEPVFRVFHVFRGLLSILVIRSALWNTHRVNLSAG